MPYRIEKKGDQHCVVKEDDGKQVACHDSRAKALAQMRALYANEKADLGTTDGTLPCATGDCSRRFVDFDAMLGHLEKVHGEGVEEARDVKAGERKKLAGKGQAIKHKDGSVGFPIKTVADLKNAIQAFGRAKNKAATKAFIIRRAKALGATKLLPNGWLASGDKAHLAPGAIDCPECDRAFLTEDLLFEHAEAVHTFDDIQRLVSEVVLEKYHERGDYRANPPVPSVWAWVQDLATDWVVFSVEKDGDTTLYKASYSITDGAVTLGEPTEVRRRTVYEPVKEKD